MLAVSLFYLILLIYLQSLVQARMLDRTKHSSIIRPSLSGGNTFSFLIQLRPFEFVFSVYFIISRDPIALGIDIKDN